MSLASLIAFLLVLVLAGCGGSDSTHATVHVFFCTDQTCSAYATPNQIAQVRSKLESNPLVKSVRFVSRQEAFAEMKKENPSLTEKVKANPLPDAFLVTANSGDGSAIAATLKPYPPGVEYVRYSER